MILNLTNLILSWMLVCLIWLIQLVHYPSFSFIDSNEFDNFHQHHTSSITWIVIPLMLSELILSFYLAYKTNWQLIYLVPLTLVILIWLSTFFIQIPIHNILSNGKDLGEIKKLVNTNWFRTILWTAKSLWLSYYFLQSK